jgi:hypothetical protein
VGREDWDEEEAHVVLGRGGQAAGEAGQQVPAELGLVQDAGAAVEGEEEQGGGGDVVDAVVGVADVEEAEGKEERGQQADTAVEEAGADGEDERHAGGAEQGAVDAGQQIGAAG